MSQFKQGALILFGDKFANLKEKDAELYQEMRVFLSDIIDSYESDKGILDNN